MDKNDTLKISLIVVFFGVLISGILITFNNYRRWNSVKTSITAEYKKAETSDPVSITDNEEIPGNEEGTDQTPDTDNPDNDDQNTNNTTENQHNTDNSDRDENGTPDTDNSGGDQNGAPDTGDTGEDQNGAPDTGDTGEDQNETPDTDNTGDTQNEDQDTESNGEDKNTEDIENTGNREDGMNMEGFYITGITDDIFERIKGRSFPESCTVSRDELRYVHIRHYGFEMEIRDGELIVNAAIAKDVLEIFEELYNLKYQIEKVRLIDEYDADDEKSMEANNSSCFNYRTIAESSTLSNHAYGRAIDINPFYNPYVYTRSDGSLFLQPKGSERYVDRTVDAACIIRKGDVCYNTFIKHGFKWGGDWETKKDYQHFEKTD